MPEETTPGIRPVTVQEAGDFIFKRLTEHDYKCPVCLHQKFVLAYAGPSEGTMKTFQLVASLAPLHSFATIPLVCETCGYVSLFSHKIIGDKIHGTTPIAS